MISGDVAAIAEALHGGAVVPFLGPGVLALNAANADVPSSPDILVHKLTAKTSVPHKIRNNLTAAAQFIENFKHRKTVVSLMTEAYTPPTVATSLHRLLATLPEVAMIVDTWYDATMANALAAYSANSWGQIQGQSQSEHFGHWTQAFRADGSKADGAEIAQWHTLLYKPLGSIAPAKNFLVSDTDFVEVLTEIDIQTPIPAEVQERRTGRNFLFLGCRFSNQLERTYARQVMKRSSHRHWAVLPEAPTKNELRFMREQNIQRIDKPLAEFVDELTRALSHDGMKHVANA